MNPEQVAGLAGVAATGVLAVWARSHASKCPFHRNLFIVSSAALVAEGLLILYQRGTLKRLRQGGARKGRTTNGRKSEGILGLVRKNILELEPYRCARDDYDKGILLDANENAFGPTLPDGHEELELERYPDPYQLELKTKIAEYRGVRPEQLFVGVGSDEAIDLIIRIFCVPGVEKVLITPPTYGMYKVCARTNDVGIVSVPLTPTFEVRVPEVLAALTPEVKLIFICSPGNPTAKLVPLDVVSELAEAAHDAVVVVDEAYVDFALDPKAASACQLLDKYHNVIVLQTLSKAFGLAGIRCGVAIGNEEIIKVMNNVKAPYNVNKLTSNKAQEAFNHIHKLNEHVTAVRREKERVIKELERLEFVRRIHHSDTNFVLFEVPNAYNIYKEMAAAGVVVRYRGTELHCKDCIRMTIGRPPDNDSFLDAFKRTAQMLLAKYP